MPGGNRPSSYAETDKPFDLERVECGMTNITPLECIQQRDGNPQRANKQVIYRGV